MTNEAQKNAKTLIRILTEDKFKKKYAPLVVGFGVIALGVLSFFFFKTSHSYKEKYYIGREDKLSTKDIDQAIKDKINLHLLGKEKRHILYYLASKKYNLKILKYLKDSGIKLNELDNGGKNSLERIILDLKLDEVSMENVFYENISVLISLEMKVSDETIKSISKSCQDGSLLTCLKMAYYFKAINKMELAKSYAKRSCYSAKDYFTCKIASTYILKD